MTKTRRTRRPRADFYTHDALTEADKEALLQACRAAAPAADAVRMSAWLTETLQRRPQDIRTITNAIEALSRAATARKQAGAHGDPDLPENVRIVLDNFLDILQQGPPPPLRPGELP